MSNVRVAMHIRLATLCCVFLAMIAGSASAQQLRTEGPETDHPPAAQRGWVSLGVGVAHFGGTDGAALRLSGSYSRGPFVGLLRHTAAIEDLDYGRSINETALLGGLRTGGSNLYLTAAIGPVKFHWTDDCLNSCGDEDRTALGYDVGIHASKRIAGLAVSLFGVAGSGNARVTAFAVSLEAGWFGR